MRVEQQNTNVVDVLKQNIGPENRENNNLLAGISNLESSAAYFVDKVEQTGRGKSFNVKDATYLKPQAEEKKTLTDTLERGAALDASERKEQMAVLANTTSVEDYARMQEEGFSLDETTSNTIVTETDKIKAQLAKAGVDISFFGDDLSMEQLEAIAGSAELATQIAQTLSKADIPCTEENIKDAVESIRLAQTMQPPSDGAIKYLVDNELPPTIENLYKAEHCGNYQTGAGVSLDIKPFIRQVEKVITHAGLAVDEGTLGTSKWMLENSIPLNEENLKYVEALKHMELPMDEQRLMDNIATAIAEGKWPQDAMMLGGKTLQEQAEHTYNIVQAATDQDVAYLVDNGMDINVRNLSYAIAAREQGAESLTADMAGKVSDEDTTERTADMVSSAVDLAGTEQQSYSKQELALLTARRQLEETRLVMTTEANYALLKKGIQIDTQPLVKLVEELKATENSYYENLLRGQGVEAVEENISLLRETTEKVSNLKSAPAYVLGMSEIKTATVSEVHDAGEVLRDTFARANERYETLMTAPRADLGDSIQKAFRNVDDILTDIGLEATEVNRRAVRILGYNQLAITPESVTEMKAVDEEVQRAFHNLTPATVTEMIRQGINPLDMDFTTLNQVAEQIQATNESKENERFSEFLWKLEQSNSITEEERKSYIGTYRLIHQVEKTDGAAIGALVHQGAEITMRNLMMAVRSERRSGKMDYAVDENAGVLENDGYQGTSIIDQVEASYQNNCLKDVADALTPNKMQQVMSQGAAWMNMTPEQLKAALAQANTEDADIDYAYAKEQLAQLSESAKVAENIYAVLEHYDIPNTISNIMAMEEMVKNRNGMYRQIFGDGVKDEDEEVTSDDLAEMKQQVLEAFGEAIAAPEELAEAQERLGMLAENVMRGMIESDEVTSLDVREMRLLAAQLSINNTFAKEEQYSVPVMVGDGVINVSLKIVRGAEKKGIVDITMESNLRGKIAATFQAKENGIKGLIATDNAETKELLGDVADALMDNIDSEESFDIHNAHISDLDFASFSMGLFGAEATKQENIDKESEIYQVQTARLYRIAENFIQQVREVL